MKEMIFRTSDDGIVMNNASETELVRCKDCIHRGKIGCVLAAIAAENCYPLFMLDNRGDWFCADGKRKKGR